MDEHIYNPYEHLHRKLDLLLAEVSQLNPSNQDDIMEIEEAAKFCKLSVHELYRQTSKRTVPFNKIGRRVMFSRKALLKWVKEKGVTPK